MFINLNKANRGLLNIDQQEFLLKIVPLARQLQVWTGNKAEFRNIPSNGIYTSIFLGIMIYYSQWGSHPVSRMRIDKNLNANNLALLQSNDRWVGKVIDYEGKEYKSFKSFMEFIINWSDEICMYGFHDTILNYANEDQQLQDLLYFPEDYDKILTIIDFYSLREFDYGRKEEARTI